MLKSELVQQINLHNKNLNSANVEAGVNLILKEISAYLEDNKRAEIRGFGTFSTTYQKPRKAVNPQNLKKINLPARYLAHFKMSKSLQDKINNNQG